MSKSIFLWPTARPPKLTEWSGRKITTTYVEQKIANLYPNSFPVLFSSARAAINAALVYLDLKRPDLTWLPKFSSHCLIDTVARVCTPTPILSKEVRVAIIYHQWGFLFVPDFGDNVTTIDDAVDTLFVPGTQVFSKNAHYTVCSLPKTLGTLAGGVLFCKQESDAIAIRAARDKRPASHIQTLIRLLLKKCSWPMPYWAGMEPTQGAPTNPLLHQISKAVDQIPEKVDHCMKTLTWLSSDAAANFFKAGRLPSNIPLLINQEVDELWESNGPFSAGVRTFNASRSVPDWVSEKVLPLPVHIDTDPSELMRIFEGRKTPPSLLWATTSDIFRVDEPSRKR